MIALKTVAHNVHDQFAILSDAQIQTIIYGLCQEKRIQILDGNASEDEKIICLIPQNASQ